MASSDHRKKKDRTYRVWSKCWCFSKERGVRESWLTCVLNSGSLTCRPGISLMAEDKLSLHKATLFWCPTFERLASNFFSDAGDRETKTVRGEVEKESTHYFYSWLGFQRASQCTSPVCLPPQETAQAWQLLTRLRLLAPQLIDLQWDVGQAS